MIAQIKYNGSIIATVSFGQTVALNCAGQNMAGKVEVTLLEQIPTPSITLDGNNLNISDESGLATEFVILVDGLEKATVSKA